MVTLSAAEVARHTILGLAPSIEAAEAIQERLAQGESAENLLRELVDRFKGTPEGKGLVLAFQAGHYYQQGLLREALKAGAEAREAWSATSVATYVLEGQCLTLLKQYDAAFAAFAKSYKGMSLVLVVKDTSQDVHARWAAAGTFQALEGLTHSDIGAFEAGGEKVIAVLKTALAVSQESAVWEEMDEVKQALPPE
ncbi:MAG: hypothetical protein EXR55_02725 [Dehalococcoidia bacterium]|nr:hypothetical protein [Dehalococcoidia bacterium]